jgi:GNAT superfamily N-acetyltransferase
MASVRVSWDVVVTPVDHVDARRVLREYYDEIVSRYFGRQATTEEIDRAIKDEPSDDLVLPTGVFLLGRDGDEVTGCVGLRIVAPELAELTRMFVRPAARARGGASRLLREAESRAIMMRVRTIRLDTREDLVEARALYAKHGYAEVAAFNDSPYADHWFSKDLD